MGPTGPDTATGHASERVRGRDASEIRVDARFGRLAPCMA